VAVPANFVEEHQASGGGVGQMEATSDIVDEKRGTARGQDCRWRRCE